jgi:hypothetical protein
MWKKGSIKYVCAFKEQYPVQASKILSTTSSFYGVNPSVGAEKLVCILFRRHEIIVKMNRPTV